MQLDMLTPGVAGKPPPSMLVARRFLALAPTAPLAFPLMRIPVLARALWPIAQVALGVREAPVAADMRGWQSLRTPLGAAPRSLLGRWRTPARFAIRAERSTRLRRLARQPIRDYHPPRSLRRGLLDIPGEQWMEIEWLQIRDA